MNLTIHFSCHGVGSDDPEREGLCPNHVTWTENVQTTDISPALDRAYEALSHLGWQPMPFLRRYSHLPGAKGGGHAGRPMLVCPSCVKDGDVVDSSVPLFSVFLDGECISKDLAWGHADLLATTLRMSGDLRPEGAIVKTVLQK